METPVALILFNRMDTTKRVLAEIAKAKPRKLFVIADGPRETHPGEAEKCAATRALINRVDWDCQVETNFSDHNMGLVWRITSGLDWVFENVEEAIILEDDCLPHPTFFPFCEELLARYSDDERVMMIAGTNLLGEWKSDVQSYHFSCLGPTWGWATWSRAWRLYDLDIKLWPRLLEDRFLENLFHNRKHAWYWKTIFDTVYESQVKDCWDYQWVLACWLQSGYRIIPAANLIANIGWEGNATNTFHQSPLANLAARSLSFPLKHPAYVARCVDADNQIQEHLCNLNAIAKILHRMKDQPAISPRRPPELARRQL